MTPPPPRRLRSAPQIAEGAIDEILLRIPPDDPASLARASAVCRAWRRILADPAFPGRYRALHRTPPVLGFFRDVSDRQLPRFIPTSSFRPPAYDLSECHVLDCRHGRVVLYDCNDRSGGYRGDYAVWDLVTGARHRVSSMEVPEHSMNSAVLCAAAAGHCDHHGCGGGPFLVAFAGVERLHDDFDLLDAQACVYSSETGEWSSTEIHLDDIDHPFHLEPRPAALIGGALHFVGNTGIILRYDVLGGKGLSLIKPPAAKRHLGSIVVMPAEAGGGELGLASLCRFSLRLWSRETAAGADGDAAGWVVRRVIDLKNLLPVRNPKSPYLRGFADGANVIFVSTGKGSVFTIELESLRTRKVGNMDGCRNVFPHTSFCIPAARAGNGLPSPAESR